MMSDDEDFRNSILGLIDLLDTSRMDVKIRCLNEILGLSGSFLCVPQLMKEHKLYKKLVRFVGRTDELATISCLSLLNISSTVEGARAILDLGCTTCPKDDSVKAELVAECLKNIRNARSETADTCCMILCNLTRNPCCNSALADYFTMDVINQLVDVFCNTAFSKVDNTYDYLGPLFSNIAQSPGVRELIFTVAKRLFPFTEYSRCTIRRGGIVSLIKNMSFQIDKHMEMLDPEGMNVLPHLLLPLAGPEEIPEDEMEQLPIELQYLPETKEREKDIDIKIIILETLLQFCATFYGRNYLREKNVYVLLRELHKSEMNNTVILACENVVDILIRTEEEIGISNYFDLDIPEHLEEKFKEMDLEEARGSQAQNTESEGASNNCTGVDIPNQIDGKFKKMELEDTSVGREQK